MSENFTKFALKLKMVIFKISLRQIKFGKKTVFEKCVTFLWLIFDFERFTSLILSSDG